MCVPVSLTRLLARVPSVWGQDVRQREHVRRRLLLLRHLALRDQQPVYGGELLQRGLMWGPVVSPRASSLSVPLPHHPRSVCDASTNTCTAEPVSCLGRTCSASNPCPGPGCLCDDGQCVQTPANGTFLQTLQGSMAGVSLLLMNEAKTVLSAVGMTTPSSFIPNGVAAISANSCGNEPTAELDVAL